MMRVRIVPPAGCDGSMLDERGWAELPDGATVRDALRLIRCDPIKAKLLLVSVNGERVKLSTPLADGDGVGFFTLMRGG